MGAGGQQQTPWTYQANDYLDRVLRISVAFNNATRALTGATVVRDPGCLYSRIYFGTGPDGKPDSTPRKVTVPVGTTNLTAGQLSSAGLDTIEGILALQITAGP